MKADGPRLDGAATSATLLQHNDVTYRTLFWWSQLKSALANDGGKPTVLRLPG